MLAQETFHRLSVTLISQPDLLEKIEFELFDEQVARRFPELIKRHILGGSPEVLASYLAIVAKSAEVKGVIRWTLSGGKQE